MCSTSSIVPLRVSAAIASALWIAGGNALNAAALPTVAVIRRRNWRRVGGFITGISFAASGRRRLGRCRGVFATLPLQRCPALGAQSPYRLDVDLEDRGGVGEGGDGAGDARLAKQMQRRIRRSVRGIAEVVRPAAPKTVLRIKTRHLDRALEAEALDGSLDVAEEIVEVYEVAQHFRMDQQRRFYAHLGRIG